MKRISLALFFLFMLLPLPANAGGDANARFHKAEALRSRGDGQVRQRNWRAAAGCYYRALKRLESISRDFPEWDPVKVEQSYRECRRLGRLMDATVLTLSAQASFDRGNLSRAVMLYDRLLKAYGAEFKGNTFITAARLAVGHALRGLGKFDESLEAYVSVIEERPDDSSFLFKAYLGLALSSYAKGRMDDARGYIRSARDSDALSEAKMGYVLELLPVESWSGLGKAFPVLMDFLATSMDEKEFIRRAGRLEPGLKDELIAFTGLRLQMRGDYGEAAKRYRACLERAGDKNGVGVLLSRVSLSRIEKLIQ